MRPWKDKINYFKALEQNLREMGLRTRMVTVIIRAVIVIVLLRVIIDNSNHSSNSNNCNSGNDSNDCDHRNNRGPSS